MPVESMIASVRLLLTLDAIVSSRPSRTCVSSRNENLCSVVKCSIYVR